jgi:hypothetical protein
MVPHLPGVKGSKNQNYCPYNFNFYFIENLACGRSTVVHLPHLPRAPRVPVLLQLLGILWFLVFLMLRVQKTKITVRTISIFISLKIWLAAEVEW